MRPGQPRQMLRPMAITLFTATLLAWLALPALQVRGGEDDDPFGACCLLPGVCTGGLTESACEDVDGIWQGPFSNCTNNNCLPGACCRADRACDLLTQGECNLEGGDFQGTSTDCRACVEPVLACCFATGGCLDLTETDCGQAGGSPLFAGSRCASDACDQVGACCLPDGSCQDEIAPEKCATMQGEYQGGGSDCKEARCETILSACCFDTEFCLLLSLEDCTNVGATWLGPGATCRDLGDGSAGNPCAGSDDATSSPDLNGDGVVDVFDLLLLLDAWGPCPDAEAPGERAACAADLNQDGVVDVFDLLLLLDAWGPVEE